MAWFQRTKGNIAGEAKKEIPDGLWVKCEQCGEIIHKMQLEKNLWTCTKCNHHFRIGSKEYIDILLDEKSFKEMDAGMRSTDPLEFVDLKPYKKRIEEAIKKTGLNDAVRTGTGKMDGMPVVLAVMDFVFIGGSMGSVVGEKVARAIDKAIKTKKPLIIISASGGARMMEAAYSLMQLAKTCGKLSQLSDLGVPFISVITDPTTGGVSASYAMLGDVNIAEPNALIAFAGPRVVKQATGKDLPKGFQRAEFVQDKGFIDLVVDRKEMRETISKLLSMMQN